MARFFNRALSQALCTNPSETDAGDGQLGVFTLNPSALTLSLWCQVTGAGGSFRRIMEIGAFNSSQGGVAFFDQQSPFGGAVTGAVYATSQGSWSGTFGSFTAPTNTWFHLAMSAQPILHTWYANGVQRGQTTFSRGSGSSDVSIAAELIGAGAQQFGTCRIAEVAIYSSAFFAEDIEDLSQGVSPLTVRPDDLIFYAPMIGGPLPALDIVGGATLGSINDPVVAEHPPIAYGAPAMQVTQGAPTPPVTERVFDLDEDLRRFHGVRQQRQKHQRQRLAVWR